MKMHFSTEIFNFIIFSLQFTYYYFLIENITIDLQLLEYFTNTWIEVLYGGYLSFSRCCVDFYVNVREEGS